MGTAPKAMASPAAAITTSLGRKTAPSRRRPQPIFRDGVEKEASKLCVRHARRKKKQESSSSVGFEEGQGFRTGEKRAMAVQPEAAAGSFPRLMCSRCGTSRTPMWRSGPAGPKTLCNACGIRYRKMRRSGGPSSCTAAIAADVLQRKQEAAAAAATEEEEVEVESSEQGKKPRKRLRRRREVLWMLLREGRRFSSRCGEEEAEAAMLLMAISSGLFVHTSQ
ncbi:hypothetical protein Taro_003122 [Colocasia esculenta]|uniref:GATA-type domain-containing protein n=1 Tax=Colocasia esculenta TaxID=4460 RepID=A0A843TIX7_COLES|nr:hypothetical protein [Colocasia esculenta]